MVSRDVVFNEAEAWSWSNEETVKEQPMVNEPDEPLQDDLPPTTPPSPQHATPSPARGLHLLGKVIVANPPCNEVQSK